MPKSSATNPEHFNQHVSSDSFFLLDSEGVRWNVTHLVDGFCGLQCGVLSKNPSSATSCEYVRALFGEILQENFQVRRWAEFVRGWELLLVLDAKTAYDTLASESLPRIVGQRLTYWPSRNPSWMTPTMPCVAGCLARSSCLTG